MARGSKIPKKAVSLPLRQRITSSIYVFLIVALVSFTLFIAGCFISAWLFPVGGDWVNIIFIGLYGGTICNILGSIVGFIIIRRVLHYDGSISRAVLAWLFGWLIVFILVVPLGIMERRDSEVLIAMMILLPYFPIVIGITAFRSKKNIRK